MSRVLEMHKNLLFMKKKDKYKHHLELLHKPEFKSFPKVKL